MSGNPQPTLSFFNNAAGNVITGVASDQYFKYLIYADPYLQFTEYSVWVNDTGTTTETDLDKLNTWTTIDAAVSGFSDYILRFECNFQNEASPDGAACCWKHDTKGMICLRAGDAAAVATDAATAGTHGSTYTTLVMDSTLVDNDTNI